MWRSLTSCTWATTWAVKSSPSTLATASSSRSSSSNRPMRSSITASTRSGSWSQARVAFTTQHPTIVFDQVAAFLQRPEQLDREERVTFRALEQRLAEILRDAVSLCIQEIVHQLEALRFSRLPEMDPDIAILAFELRQDLVEGVLFPTPAEADFFRTVGSQDQDAASRQAPAQVEQQADRRRIRPLQVVEGQQERMGFRQDAQHVGELLEQTALLQVLSCTCLLSDRFLEPTLQSWILRRRSSYSVKEAIPRDEAADQRSAALQGGLGRCGQGAPQAQGVILGDRSRGPARFDIPAEHGHDLSKGQVRVPDPGVGVAVPAGDQQIRMGFHRLVGELAQQGRLALSRPSADEGHLAVTDQRLTQEGVELLQLPLSSDENRPFDLLDHTQERWQPAFRYYTDGGCGCLQLPGQDLLVQPGRLRRWRGPQLGLQHISAGLVLGQGFRCPARRCASRRITPR